MYENTINNKQFKVKYDLISVIFPKILKTFKNGMKIANSATIIKIAKSESKTAIAGTKYILTLQYQIQ